MRKSGEIDDIELLLKGGGISPPLFIGIFLMLHQLNPKFAE
jgi:hypothetical protein